MFLANIMNLSSIWEVKHEPRGYYERDLYRDNKPLPEFTQNVFNNNYYGEVNNVMRYYFEDLKVYKKGIIFRNRKDLILSHINTAWERFGECNEVGKVNHIHKTLKMLNRYYKRNPGIIKIEFESMTTNIYYLQDMLNEFEIYDVILDSNMFKIKKNQTYKKKYQAWQELPKEVKAEYEKYFK
jgi:hypothetical protein